MCSEKSPSLQVCPRWIRSCTARRTIPLSLDAQPDAVACFAQLDVVGRGGPRCDSIRHVIDLGPVRQVGGSGPLSVTALPSRGVSFR